MDYISRTGGGGKEPGPGALFSWKQNLASTLRIGTYASQASVPPSSAVKGKGNWADRNNPARLAASSSETQIPEAPPKWSSRILSSMSIVIRDGVTAVSPTSFIEIQLTFNTVSLLGVQHRDLIHAYITSDYPQ